MTAPDEDRRRGLSEEKVLLLIANAMTAHTTAMEDRIIEAINKNLNEQVRKLDERVDAMHDVFEAHIAEAFPAGPLIGHKHDHEGRMRWAETKERLLIDLVRYCLLGAVGFVFIVLGLGLTEWVKKGISG